MRKRLLLALIPLLLIGTLLFISCSKKEPPRSGGRTAGYWAQVLHDEPKVELRVKAATKLGPLVLIDNDAFPALLLALKDSEPAVRLAAARSLGIYSGPKAGEVLPALRDVQEHDPQKSVREAASKAIENIIHPNSGN
jgi:HEAT repeat protein